METICLQIQENDCGFACLKMLLSHFQKNKDLLYLPQVYNHSDYNFLELKKIALENGVETKGYLLENKKEIYKKSYSIIQLKKENKYHFVIFRKKISKNILLYDPSVGKVNISEEEFLDLFTGYALIYIKNNRKNTYIKPHSICSFTSKIFTFFSTLIDFLLFFLGTFFIKSNYSILLCYSLLILVFINNYVKILFYQSYSNMFDRKYIKPILKMIFESKKDVKKDTYRNLVSLKKDSLILDINLITIFLSVIFLMIILLSDNIFHFIIILIVILINVLRTNFIDEKIKKLNGKIEQKEQELIVSLKMNKETSVYDEICSLSNKYMNIHFFTNIFIYFIIALCLILFIYLFHISSFNYFLFYFFIYIYLSNKIKTLFTYQTQFLLFHKEYCFYLSLQNYLLNK